MNNSSPLFYESFCPLNSSLQILPIQKLESLHFVKKMNQTIIDISLISLSLITAVIFSNYMKQRRTGMLYATFLLFPPLLVFLNMWAHTVAVSVLNIRRIQAGAFQYNFTVYSHFLFGIVFIIVSGISIHCVRKFLTGEMKQRRNIFLSNIFMFLFFLPVGLINPIRFLPVLASIFSSFVLLFDHSFRKKLHSKKEVKEKHNDPAEKFAMHI